MKKFELVCANEKNPKWSKIIERERPLYTRENELRSEFQRDHTRVLFSNSYKRMRNKTQVFFSPSNDHVCTRMEHVNYVESISYTIANNLGLNTELTRTIAVAHDLGHSPFGHSGERVLSKISEADLGKKFWHEKNGVELVDKYELLENIQGKKTNLNLTYGVRDGIISHCGEVDENSIKPREEAIDLKEYKTVNQYQSYTWEGCVVKISDKISYIIRDIEDAISLKILDEKDLVELQEILGVEDKAKLDNGNVINDLIQDIVEHSSPENGIMLSKEKLNLLNKIKEFNYKKIYFSEKLNDSNNYYELVIYTIYNFYKKLYDEGILKIKEKIGLYGSVIFEFVNWLELYSINFETDYENYYNDNDLNKYDNQKFLNMKVKEDYYEGIIEYISGMTDKKAIDVFNKLISF